MVSQETLEVVMRLKDELTQKVDNIDNKLKQMGNSGADAMNKTRTATQQANQQLQQQQTRIDQLKSKYNNMKTTVTNVFNQIKNVIKNSTAGTLISESGLAKPFLNAAEKIKQKWSSMTEHLKSKMKGVSNQNVGFNISATGLKTLDGQLATTTTKTTAFGNAIIRIGAIAPSIGSKLGTAFTTISTKISNAKGKLTNLASGLSGVQGLLMSAFATIGVTSLKSFTIEAAIAREKVNSVTKSIAGSEQAFTATQKSIKNAIAGTTLGYNNMASAVNNVALRFHLSGETLKSLPGPMAKVGLMAQAMGKSSSEAASIMEHAFDGLQGKWKSLKQIGITEADLKAAGWSGAANDINGYAAALDKVLEKNPKFKEFTSSFEYQWESFKMSVRGVGTEIGLMLLPILKQVLSFITDLSKNNPGLFKLGVILGVVLLALTSFATAILPIIMLIQAIKEITIITTIWNAVLAMNPITIVVLAVIALVAALIYLYNTNEDVRNALNGLWEFLQNSFGGVWEWLSGVITGAGDAIGGFMDWLGLLYEKFLEVLPLIMAILMPWTIMFDENIRNVAIQAVQTFVSWISTLGTQAWTWFMDVINKVILWGQQLWQNMSNVASQAVTNFINWVMTLPAKFWTWLINTSNKVGAWKQGIIDKIREVAQGLVNKFKEWVAKLPDAMKQELNNIKSKIENAAGDLGNAIKNLGLNLLNNFKNALGIHSPGFMYYAITGEMDRIDSAFSNAEGTLGASAENVGNSILDGFNNVDFSSINFDPESLLTGTQNTSTPILNSGDKGLGASADMDVAINPNISMNTQAISNDITLMANTVNPQLLAMGTSINQLGMTSTTNTNQMLLNNNMIRLSYQQMQLAVSNALQSLMMYNTNAWTNIRQTTLTNLNSILNSTKNVTTQMIQAWQTMKNSIIQAANDIKSQSEQRFNSLWNTIKTFYNRIQHPGGAGSPNLSSRSGGGRGHNAFRSFATSVQNRLGGLNSVTRNTLQNKGFTTAEIEYMIPRGTSRVSTRDIFNYITNLTRAGAGGWSGVVQPNVDWIRNTTNKWKTAAPTIVRYKTSHGFKVGDFEHGEPRISFDEFRQIAEDVFSQCHYLFYMDSAMYGDWRIAARNGGMNCSDSTDFLLAMANAFGFSGTKVHGYWNNIGHYWANIAGHKMDTTGWMNRRTWTPSASHSGPVPRGLKLSEESDNQIVIIELLQQIYNLLLSESETESSVRMIHEGEVKYNFKHDIEGSLPDGLTAEDVVEIMDAHVEDSTFLKKLTNNRDFMNKFEHMSNKILGERARFS